MKRIASICLAATVLLFAGPLVRAADPPGVTATEIKLGQTMPYSGPASSFGALGKMNVAYMQMINFFF